MGLKKQLENRIFDMEKVAMVFDIKPFDIYFLGGAACILGGYTERATRDFDFVDLNYHSGLGNVYLLSPEDIIVSKIIRLEQKDVEDISELIRITDKELINQIIDEVLLRDDLYESKKERFVKKLPQFREKYHV